MTTEELLTKVESRLSKKGNPALPPEETLRAILDLGNELKIKSILLIFNSLKFFLNKFQLIP